MAATARCPSAPQAIASDEKPVRASASTARCDVFMALSCDRSRLQSFPVECEPPQKRRKSPAPTGLFFTSATAKNSTRDGYGGLFLSPSPSHHQAISRAGPGLLSPSLAALLQPHTPRSAPRLRVGQFPEIVGS